MADKGDQRFGVSFRKFLEDTIAITTQSLFLNKLDEV